MQQLVLISKVRKLISGVDDPPVAEILQTDILEILSTVFRFTDANEHITYMKLESVWILTNLVYASGDEISVIFDPKYELVSIVNTYLTHSNPAMVEQSLWFFGNAIAESKGLRDHIIMNTNIVDVMNSMVNGSKISRTAMRTIVWVTSNIHRHKNLHEDCVIKSLPVVKAGLFLEEESIISDSLWALTYMSDT